MAQQDDITKDRTPASRGFVAFVLQGITDAIGEVLRERFAKSDARHDSTAQLLADLEQRIAALERKQ